MDKDSDLESFKTRISALLTDDPLNRKFLADQIDEIFLQRGDGRFFSRCLALFVHLTFEEDEAHRHWENILENFHYFRDVLHRDVGLRVAMFDYFLNRRQLLHDPILVEIHLFRQTTLMAMLDHLTELFNRRYFDIALEKELKRCARWRKAFSLLMIDLDNFKKINDVHGHLFGDKVLKELARVLKKMSREEDTVCRYGGEEFIILLSETSAAGALQYGERVRADLAQNDFFRSHGITFSGGISTFPVDGRTGAALVQNADMALYQAKFAGKDQILQSDSERRRGKRHPRTWKLCYQRLEQAFEAPRIREVYTQDVSLGGVRFETGEVFPLDGKLLLHITIPDGETVIVVGKVTWIRKLDGDLFQYGVQFHDLKIEQVEIMKKVLPDEEEGVPEE